MKSVMKYLSLPCFLLGFTFTSASFAQSEAIPEPRLQADEPTTLQEVLQSSLRHYPRILAAESDLSAKRSLVLAAQGQFDPRIDGSLGSRFSGYYDGQSLDTSLIQELPGFNTEVFSGYRLSDGSFPLYENASLTGNGGEYRAGIKFSLLRDRDIDEQRAKLESSRLRVLDQAQQLTTEKISTLRQAWVVYARWLLSARLHQAYNELLETAIKRREAISIQVESGDAAEILQLENEQAVLQRQGLVVDAERQLHMAAEQLSLYLRDNEGRPLYPVYSPNLEMPPEDEALLDRPLAELLSNVLARQPEIRQLELARQQLRLQEKLALNSMKPKLDLTYYLSRDTGSGLTNLRGTDNVAEISFSIPLRTRTASGKAASARAEVSSINHAIRLLSEQTQTEIRRALLNLEATREMEEIAISELSMSRQLADAENQRFSEGLSDFFLLNVRERQVGEAQLKRWQAHLSHQIALADFYAATLWIEGFAEPALSFSD